jgi:hypothetical protein
MRRTVQLCNLPMSEYCSIVFTPEFIPLAASDHVEDLFLFFSVLNNLTQISIASKTPVRWAKLMLQEDSHRERYHKTVKIESVRKREYARQPSSIATAFPRAPATLKLCPYFNQLQMYTT